ncbi:sce7726 family protein [Pseudomonas aeruginosa]|uniref:sce7726 family protein n=1 Tax=Pseudomonas aeruginosa TaxID=287 RepID=UPI002FE4BCF1
MTVIKDSLELARISSRAFGRPAFAALARGGDPRKIFKALYDAELVSSNQSVSTLFENAFSNLRSNYRNEYIYKCAITNKIVFGKHSPRTASISLELPIGKSIVDAAIFNGTSTAYEIKTEFDSPKRLCTQTPDYLRAFDKVFIVTHPDYASSYLNNSDERVGILTIDRNDRIRVIKEAIENKQNIDTRTIFRALRREEYITALEKTLKIKIEKPNGTISGYCEELFSKLSKQDAHRIFVHSMRKRTTDIETVDFISLLPSHLRVLGYSTPLSRPQRQKILSTLSM